MSAIFLHPSITAAAAEYIAAATGMDMRRTACGNFRLEPVQPAAHVAEYKRQRSIAYLREAGKYVLDPESPAPGWSYGRSTDGGGAA